VIARFGIPVYCISVSEAISQIQIQKNSVSSQVDRMEMAQLVPIIVPMGGYGVPSHLRVPAS